MKSILDDILPDIPKKTGNRPKPYNKPKSVRDFEKEYTVFYYHGREIPERLWILQKFSDKTANDLTHLIISWLKMNGYYAMRINTQGNYSQKLGKFVYSGSTRGVSDIIAVVDGRNISIEVKIGKDKLRDSQIKYKQDVENAGGVYFVAKDFDSFLDSMNKII